MPELTELAGKLGYEGSELQQFVRKCKQCKKRKEREDKQRELEIKLQIEKAKAENGGAVGPSIQIKFPLPQMTWIHSWRGLKDLHTVKSGLLIECLAISLMLAGKGLQVYATLSVKAANDYDQLKTLEEIRTQ